MAACYVPEKYKSFSLREVESQLSVAVGEHLQTKRLTAVQIRKRYPSIRPAHLNKLLNGEPLNIRMLSSISEATGMRWNLEVSA